MKRLIIISLCFLLMLSAFPFASVYAEYESTVSEQKEYESEPAEYEKEIFVLKSLNIVEGFEDGTYRLEEYLTRAQFAVLALRLLGIYEAGAFGNTDFADVAPVHWAAGHIGAAQGLNLMNGYSDGKFYPDKNVTRDEAVKVLVCALGYDIQAKDGGYPSGYLAVAIKTGLLDGVTAQGGDNISRGQAIRMLYNALEVPVITLVYGGEEKYELSGDTLMENLLYRIKMYRLRGTLEGAEETALNGKELDAGKAIINGVTYDCNLKGISEYIGVPVQFFLQDNNGTMEIVSMMPENGRYAEKELTAEDIISIDDSKPMLEWEDGNSGRKEKANLSASLSIIYNGRAANTFNLSDLELTSGTLRLIDSDFDSIYETAHVHSEKAFVIKGIEPEYRLVYFRDRLLMGKGFVRLDDEDLDMYYEILDADGNLVNLDSLAEGMDISVAASTDFRRVRVQILADNTVVGGLTQIGSDGEVAIDDAEYQLAEEADEIYAIAESDLRLGINRTWHLDADGKIFAVDDESTSEGTYAYVMATGQRGNIDKTLELKLLIGGSYVEIEDETSTKENLEDRMIKQLQNEGIFILETADKLRIDNYRYSSEEAAAVLKPDTVICFKTNEDGQIKDIKTSLLWGEEHITERTYIKKMNLFESQGGGAFTIDKNTAIINVPKEDPDFGIYMNDSDCYVKTTLKDSTEYTAQAFDYNDDTKAAAAVVIRQDMSSDAAPEITTSTPLALVTAVVHKMNADGEWVPMVSALRRGTMKEWECRSELNISNIRKGDVVRFTEDGMERIAKIELVERLEKALNPYHTDAGGINEVMFGYVQKVDLNTFTQYSSTMVSLVTLSLNGLGDGERTFTIPSRDTQPPVYVWNLETKTGNVGSFNNFRSVELSDVQNANMALIYAKSGAVQAIFIIN